MRAIPNLLTLLRLALTPAVGYAILRQRFALALLLCAVAGISDGFDGYLARRFQWTSKLGAVIDPLADKALMVTVFLSLGVVKAVPHWLVAVVLGRDVIILVLAGVALAFTGIRDFPPSWWGKISTTVQMVSAVDFMAAHAWPGSIFEWLTPLGIALTALLAAISGLHYVVTGFRRLQQP